MGGGEGKVKIDLGSDAPTCACCCTPCAAATAASHDVCAPCADVAAAVRASSAFWMAARIPVTIPLCDMHVSAAHACYHSGGQDHGGDTQNIGSEKEWKGGMFENVLGFGGVLSVVVTYCLCGHSLKSLSYNH